MVMGEGTAAPIEWVRGSRRWLLRFATVPVFAGLLAWLSWAAAHDSPAIVAWPEQGYFWGMYFATLVAQLVLTLYSPPRRIGLSTTGLTFDVGLRRVTYPWRRVYTVVRKNVYWSESGRIGTVCRTSVSIDDGWNLTRLSPAQGDRLAAFLRIP